MVQVGGRGGLGGGVGGGGGGGGGGLALWDAGVHGPVQQGVSVRDRQV